MKRINIGRRTHDYMLIPAIAVLDMDSFYGEEQMYRFRLALGFWNWRMSIGLGRPRWEE